MSKRDKSILHNEEVFLDGFHCRLQGIAFNDSGYMYVCMDNSDKHELHIIKVNPQKEACTIAIVNADGPTGLCSYNNELYLAARGNVYKVSQKGEINILVDGFSNACDIKFDLSGNMYVCDGIANRVYKITTSLEKSVFIEDNTSFDFPAMAFDVNYQKLYVLDAGQKFDGNKVTNVGGRLLEYTINSDGALGTRKVILKDLKKPLGITVCKNGRIYISLTGDNSILAFYDKDQSFILKSSEVFDGIQRLAIGNSEFGNEALFISSWSNKIVKVRIA